MKLWGVVIACRPTGAPHAEAALCAGCQVGLGAPQDYVQFLTQLASMHSAQLELDEVTLGATRGHLACVQVMSRCHMILMLRGVRALEGISQGIHGIVLLRHETQGAEGGLGICMVELCAPRGEPYEQSRDMRFDAQVRAYHFGARFIVEMEVVMPAEMTVRESHDIALQLQHKVHPGCTLLQQGEERCSTEGKGAMARLSCG